MTLKGPPIERAIRDHSASLTVVLAVAEATNADPTELEPLAEAIDPDALEALVRSLRRSDRDADDASVEFRLNGCHVTVYTDGRIELRHPDGDETPVAPRSTDDHDRG